MPPCRRACSAAPRSSPAASRASTKSNLKKQGLLALTFQADADYERIREDDRISLLGIAHLAPGKPVECRITHADGTNETLWLRHSFSASQLHWFRAGAAVNLVRDA